MWFKAINDRLRKLNCFDYAVLKVCVFTFTLLLVKFLPDLMSLDWYWYALVFAVTYGYLIARIFSK